MGIFSYVFTPAVLLAVCFEALSATATYTTSVTRVLTDSENYGGCMAMVSPGPEAPALGLSCLGSWVTFSCDGTFNSKSIGNSKLSAAQLGLVTGVDIIVGVDDTKKHNGYCFATRVDNLAPSGE